MAILKVNTLEYDIDLMKIIGRRFTQAGSDVIVSPAGEHAVEIEFGHDDDAARVCAALAEVLLKDAAHFELARMVNDLPLPLEERQLILPEAIKLSRRVAAGAAVRRALGEHIAEYNTLSLEGFMRFRMGEVLKAFERCVGRAVEEWMLRNEYIELMSVLSEFVRIQQPRMKEIYLILNADGSCTLTDDNDSRIDYDRCSDDGVVSMLVGLAPERITVYDLSCGKSTTLLATLVKVFEDRIRFFR